MATPRRYYRFVVPASWAILDGINFLYPGDEYGGFAASSLPGLWIMPLVDGPVHPVHFLAPILVAGSLTMAVLGWAMDRLRVPWIPWMLLLIAIAGTLEAYELQGCPSLERALMKFGSPAAIILPAINLGLLGSSVLSILIVGPYRAATRARRRRRGGAGEAGAS
jgi:hypothetical protein